MKLRHNKARADKAVEFFHKHLKHTKGRWKGHPFILDEWQEHEIIRPLFGNERWSPELERWVRQYRTAYIEIPAKNGKSEMGAGFAAQGLFADGEGTPEVYGLAASKDQAKLIFTVMASMVNQSPALSKRAEIYDSKIGGHGLVTFPKVDGFYKVLPADVATGDGINASRVVLDEVHRQPDRHLIDMLNKSSQARDEPLFVMLTTAGDHDPNHIATEIHEYALQVLKGVIDNPYFFAYVMSATKEETDGDKWRNEELWLKLNPSLRGFNASGIDTLRQAAMEASASPAKVAAFKRYHLNVWLPKTASSADKLLDLAVWDRSAGLIRREELKNRKAWVGVDMAATTDIASAVAIVPRETSCPDRCTETCYTLLPRFWIPDHNLTEDGKPWTRTLRDQLALWVDAGHIEVQPGEIIDDGPIVAVIQEWATEFELQRVVKDPWQSKQLGITLDDHGFDVADHGQSMLHMAYPTSEFVRLATAGRIHAGGNPVMRWMIENTIAKSDPEGNIKPDKKRSSGKVDGVVASIMALSQCLADTAEPERTPMITVL